MYNTRKTKKQTNRNQLDLFAAKMHSDSSRLVLPVNASFPTSTSRLPVSPLPASPLDMKFKRKDKPFLPGFFDNGESTNSNDDTDNAIQNRRSWPLTRSAAPSRKAQEQQLLTFDDEPAGDHAAAAPLTADGEQSDATNTGSKNPDVPPVIGADDTSTGANAGGVRSRDNHLQGHHPLHQVPDELAPSAIGEKAKARDILAAIKTLKQLELDNRNANEDEKAILRRFGGFGPVALSLFPDPITGKYKDASWEKLGHELSFLLSDEEYESAKRTTFNAFYTSPLVIEAMHQAIAKLGVADQSTVLEPGCGVGNFLSQLKPASHAIGVEMDRISGQIARQLYPQHDIRIENFRDTKLAENSLDAVIGNVPFANIKLDHRGTRYSLHDYFFAKSLDAVKPGGVMALVTSHFTLDKQNASIREYLASKADFVGAIRLPADAFKNEGTKVVTDIIFLKKRNPGQQPSHIDADWLNTGPCPVITASTPVNQYFLNHPEMVLGDWTAESQLYGNEGYSIKSSGDLGEQLNAAIARLPGCQSPENVKPVRNEQAATSHTRPPPPESLTEGSFFVGDNQQLFQIEHGSSVPAMHGSTLLKANGTMMGKRLAALIRLRTAARLVLTSQNEDWPESERQAARSRLNLVYDGFVSAYGPINKTTFSQTKDGTVIRRMPNLVKFKDDPDAMLVMSLEDYDEVTGKATKASIFSRDVVGPKHEITQVRSAEDGLLASLDRYGDINLAFIAKIYGKPEHTIIAELGDLIFQNPETERWETADIYLSGDVRHKLAIAEAAGDAFAHNAEQLRKVQPPDILPGDIDARLGSPWIPASDIRQFAAELFGVSVEQVDIGHLAKDATWSLAPGYQCENSVKATSEFGTSRINGTRLLELALNMKTPVIYDTIKGVNGDERILNQDETLAAREKQKLIKEKFKSWVFSDPERTERLVRSYNDTYNNLRPRLFAGSHLEFTGLNQTIDLRQHQKDAVWRVMSSGNTLLAHAVGAGKTFTMAAAGMKLKQAGLVKKPMFVVPNHMLEQFSREFMQLYPNAHLLVASKEDMSRDRRKYLTARIASHDWDGIIVTHSSFERIGMSKQYQEQFLNHQISEYADLLTEAHSSSGSHRNLIKTIEKQKANRENKLKELSAEDKKDDGLVFDELGVDHVFIDESHYFKNLETATKMDRVAGIQTGGSQRAFDIYMKSQYLSKLHPGHGVTFATGTPISNTMVELFNIQRFLDPKGLRDRGIEHFDAWAANFGEVVDSMEISPDGSSLRSRSRFAKFSNLPELQQMFRAYADVQTASMLNLPRPSLKTNQPITISCPMSDDQAQLQAKLVERYERLRSSKVDPREDNALAITTDGRKLALDARMLTAEATDAPDSKINALVHNVISIWKESAPVNGTQLIFSDMGVHPTAWGFSAYHDVIQKLVKAGIPADQIASIGDADSDAKKQALFDKVRSGKVRILLGSTQKMGTGTNVQKRLVALHHLDAPWKPAEVEQRDGRILRQGNLNPEVAIYRYVTQGSFDAYMWQALETKARFISQVMTGDVNQRTADDIGGQELSYAEVKAIASGNPAVLTLAETDAELQRLAVLRKNHLDDQYLIRRKLMELPGSIERLGQRLNGLEADFIKATSTDLPEFSIEGHPYAAADITRIIAEKLERLPTQVSSPREFKLGEYSGLEFGLIAHPYGPKQLYLKGNETRVNDLSSDRNGPRAILNALQRMVSSYAERIDDTRQRLSVAEQQVKDYQERSGSKFEQEGYATELRSLRDQLRNALSQNENDTPKDEKPVLSASEIASQIEQLRSSQIISHGVEREHGKKQTKAIEAITTQIHKRKEEQLIADHRPHESHFRDMVSDKSGETAVGF